MSNSYINQKTRDAVTARANDVCEYCLVPSFAIPYTYQVDHIISEKMGGENDIGNLAYSCPYCNRHKGPAISSYSGNPPQVRRLFNPRTDLWTEHFAYTDEGILTGKTDIGLGTIHVLNINDPRRLKDRALLFEAGIMTIN